MTKTPVGSGSRKGRKKLVLPVGFWTKKLTFQLPSVSLAPTFLSFFQKNTVFHYHIIPRKMPALTVRVIRGRVLPSTSVAPQSVNSFASLSITTASEAPSVVGENKKTHIFKVEYHFLPRWSLKPFF